MIPRGCDAGSGMLRWLTRTLVQTFVLCPLAVIVVELALHGGEAWNSILPRCTTKHQQNHTVIASLTAPARVLGKSVPTLYPPSERLACLG
jgi:hypothetical protein